MRVSVVIPSFGRPTALSRCIEGCQTLVPSAAEIIVCLREDDAPSRSVAAAAGVTIVTVDQPGHLPPLVAALNAVSGDVMAVTDDDAVPRTDWLLHVGEWFADTGVVAIGGPVQNHPAPSVSAFPKHPGTLSWYGGLQRNAIPGETDVAYEPQYLSGGNVAYRVCALREVGLDMELNRGAAVHYEADVGLSLRRVGRLVFDPRMVVDHYPAKRSGAPDRGDAISYVLQNAYAQYYIISKHVGAVRRILFLTTMFVVGQRKCPGLLRLVPTAKSVGVPAMTMYRRLSAARRSAWRIGRASRSAHLRAESNGAGMAATEPVVTIVYKTLPQYRLRFFDDLRTFLSERGVRLRLIYGQPSATDALKADTVGLAWAEKIDSIFINIGSRSMLWQPVLGKLRGSDLVVVEQAGKLLVNYPLLLLNALRLQRMAFWGHGRNFQARNRGSLSERVKSLISKHVFWWFAYNKTSAEVVEGFGFPPERITVVQNSVDTADIARAKSQITDEATQEIKRSLGIATDARLCAYVGGMYPEKRLEFLIEACDYIRGETGTFEMLFVGAGPSAGVIEDACRSRSWMHYVGPQFGERKVALVSAAELLLLPGLVGLAIVDSFALEIPLITTAVTYHSPEIEYLNDGVNGVMVRDPDSVKAYGDTVVSVLMDEQLMAELRQGCRVSASQYTMEAMVENFGLGLLEALKAEW